MSNKERVNLLTDTEVEELYALPQFNDAERDYFFQLSDDEYQLVSKYTGIKTKILLENVNKIGMEMKPPDDDFVFIRLSPYLDNLMAFLKRLNSTEMQMVLIEYEGVMKVMRMMEECAQQMEKDLGLN